MWLWCRSAERESCDHKSSTMMNDIFLQGRKLRMWRMREQCGAEIIVSHLCYHFTVWVVVNTFIQPYMKTIPMAFITLEVPRDIEAMLNNVVLNCNNAICIFVAKSFLAYNNDNDDNSKKIIMMMIIIIIMIMIIPMVIIRNKLICRVSYSKYVGLYIPLSPLTRATASEKKEPVTFVA